MTHPTHTFGPPSHQWTYDQFSDTDRFYTLSTPASHDIHIKTTEGNVSKGSSIIVDPRKSAFVIVDMQNYFLHEKCRIHPNGLAAVEPTIKVIEHCRKIGVQVIWLNWGLTEHDLQNLPSAVLRSFKSPSYPSSPFSLLGTDLGPSLGRGLVANSWNADIYTPLLPHILPSDIHCPKNRMSGLWSEDQALYKVLKERGIETLFFGGVNTDQCVGGTLTDAYNRGWSCVLVDDCCGTTTQGGREVWVHNISSSYGFVTSSEEFVKSVSVVLSMPTFDHLKLQGAELPFGA